MTSATEIAADWYPDPTGKYERRYWNGLVWTEHAFSAGVQSVEPMPATADNTPAAKRPRLLRRRDARHALRRHTEIWRPRRQPSRSAGMEREMASHAKSRYSELRSRQSR
jgi:hypothetical protein